MQNLLKHTLYSFLFITLSTGILALIGLGYTWFLPDGRDLPYVNLLIGSVVIEIVAVVIIIAKKGMQYIPDVITNKETENTVKFMRDFISNGTNAIIVSNRVSWLSSNDDLIKAISDNIDKGRKIEIITPNPLPNDLRDRLKGVIFTVTHEKNAPEARFTIVNVDRSGSERLAIARGVHPNHEITVFDNNSGPQIIAMAKDIIKKSKGLSRD